MPQISRTPRETYRHCHCGDGGWVFGVAAGAAVRCDGQRDGLPPPSISPFHARACLRLNNAKAKIVCLAVLTALARLGLQGASFVVFRIFPSDEGNEKSFAPRRGITAHIFIVHTIVAQIGAIARCSRELGDVALAQLRTVAAVRCFQDPYGIAGLFILCGDAPTGEQRTIRATDPSAQLLFISYSRGQCRIRQAAERIAP